MFIKKIALSVPLFIWLLALPCFSFGADNDKATSKATKPTAGDSKKVYTGDPATKRGYELGYDYGVKAGKEDKKNGRKENPSSHEEYKTGEKKFRSEYGNRSKFVAGYQGGFLKGYKSGFNREKTDPEAAKQAKLKDKNEKNTVETKSKKVSSESLGKESTKSDSVAPSKPARAKPKAPSAADDAL